jgi:hypothetical protein
MAMAAQNTANKTPPEEMAITNQRKKNGFSLPFP